MREMQKKIKFSFHFRTERAAKASKNIFVAESCMRKMKSVEVPSSLKKRVVFDDSCARKDTNPDKKLSIKHLVEREPLC